MAIRLSLRLQQACTNLHKASEPARLAIGWYAPILVCVKCEASQLSVMVLTAGGDKKCHKTWYRKCNKRSSFSACVGSIRASRAVSCYTSRAEPVRCATGCALTRSRSLDSCGHWEDICFLMKTAGRPTFTSSLNEGTQARHVPNGKQTRGKVACEKKKWLQYQRVSIDDVRTPPPACGLRRRALTTTRPTSSRPRAGRPRGTRARRA